MTAGHVVTKAAIDLFKSSSSSSPFVFPQWGDLSSNGSPNFPSVIFWPSIGLHWEINFLVTVKVSIPIAWKVLPKKTRGGNSNTRQRIALIRKLLKILPPKEISVLTMDREFTGKQWLTRLDQNEVCYIARIK